MSGDAQAHRAAEALTTSVGQLRAAIREQPQLARSTIVLERATRLEHAAVQISKDVKQGKGPKPDVLAGTSGVVLSLTSAIPVFANPQSDPYQVGASALSVTSSVFYAVSAIPLPGLGQVVSSGIGMVLGVLGPLIGCLSEQPSPTLLEQLQAMIDNAVNRLNSELTWQQLKGAMKEMQDGMVLVSKILASKHATADSATRQEFRLHDFLLAGSKEIGAARENIEINLPHARKDNWANNATSFALLSQVVAFKFMYMLQGVAYFTLVDEALGADHRYRADILLTSIMKQRADYAEWFGRFLVKPDLNRGALTDELFRLPEAQFRTIAQLAGALGLDDRVWPRRGDQFGFPYGPKKVGVIRMTTSFAGELVLDGDWKFSNTYPANDKTYVFHTTKVSPKDDEGRPIYAKLCYRRRIWTYDEGTTPRERTVYLFEVEPSTEERRRFGIPEGRPLLIIGEPSHGGIWHITSNHALGHEPYEEFAKRFDEPEKGEGFNRALFYLLGPAEA